MSPNLIFQDVSQHDIGVKFGMERGGIKRVRHQDRWSDAWGQWGISKRGWERMELGRAGKRIDMVDIWNDMHACVCLCMRVCMCACMHAYIRT